MALVIYCLQHASRLIQVPEIVDRATRACSRKRLRKKWDSTRPTNGQSSSHHVVYASEAGYLQAVDRHGLRSVARERRLILRIARRIGESIEMGSR